MKQRWLVAIIGLPLLFFVLLGCPPWATMLLACAMSGVAAYELLRVAGKNVSKPVNRAVTAWTVCVAVIQVAIVFQERRWYYVNGVIPFGSTFRAPFDPLWAIPWLLTVVLFFFAVITYGKENAVPFSTVAAGIVGGAVFPMMYSCLVMLRMHEEFGRVYILAPFFIAFAGDSLAMYFGKWFGKRKLTPVSPNKTWAGFYGSILGSVLGMMLFGLLGNSWLGYAPNYLHLAYVAVAANLLGQLGDLSTSLIKREQSVKDYSRLFLTHGGMLDRFDSTLFIAPVVYLFVSVGII